MFGMLVKDRRATLGLSLREFCRRLDEDASNWSKIERGIMSPPQDTKKLNKIATILELKQGGDEWNNLINMASVEAGIIPEHIMSNKDIVNALPVFFRTIGSVKPTKEELEELIQTIKRGI